MSKEAWAYLTENYFPLVCQINALPLLVAHSYHYENIIIMKHEKQYDVMKKNNFLVGLHLGPIPGSRISKQHRVCLPRQLQVFCYRKTFNFNLCQLLR